MGYSLHICKGNMKRMLEARRTLRDISLASITLFLQKVKDDLYLLHPYLCSFFTFELVQFFAP